MSDAPRLEPVDACLICGSPPGLRFFDAFANRIFGVAGRFAYRQCRDYDAAFQSPRAGTVALARSDGMPIG